MGCSSSSIGQDRFVSMLKNSPFLDFLVRNIEESNEWDNSSLHLGEIISNDNLNILNATFRRYGAIVFNEKGVNLNVQVKGIPESDTTVYMPVGITYMGLKVSGKGNAVISQLISKNPAKSRALALDKIELETLLGYVCGNQKPQLQTVMNKSLFEVVSNNVLFNGITETQCNYLQQFLRWRFVDRNISVFEKQSYEEVTDVCALHILFDGTVVVVDPKAAAEKVEDIDKSLSFSNAVDGKGNYDSIIPSAMRVLPTSYYMCGVNLVTLCSCNICKHHKAEAEAVKDGQVQFHGQVMKVAKVNPSGSDYSDNVTKGSMHSKASSKYSANPSKYSIEDMVETTVVMHDRDFLKSDMVPCGKIPDVGSIYRKGSIFEAELSFIEDSRIIMSKVEALDSCVFATLSPAVMQKISQTSSYGKRIIDTIRNNWMYNLLRKFKKIIPIFQGISLRELREFADTAGIHAYDQKTTLFKEGGVSKKFYIVVSGHVGIYQKRENGKQTKIRWLRAGNYFGEIGMVTGMPHTATAIAAAGTVLLTADDAAFSAMYQDNRTVLTELKLRMMGDESHISLVLVLQHVRGYQMLLKFCKKEMNEENMVFWKDVDNLENYIRKYLRILKVNHEEGLTIKEDKEQKHERLRRSVIDLSILSKPILSIMHHCNKIMTKYILESGDMQVNVPDTMRNEAVKNFSEYFAVHFEGAPAFVKPDPKRPAREDNIKLLDRIIIACIKPGTHTSVGTTTEQDEFNAEEEEEMNSLMKHSLSSKTTRDQDCAPISEVIAAFEMILDLFAPSRKEILHMLESDGYRRWKTTADYKEFLSLIVAYEGVPDAYKKTLMPPENSDYEDF